MKLSTAAQMRELDRKAIETGVPDIVLMENASLKSFFKILEYYGDVRGKLAICFVGAGNNGGDALAIGRHLFNAGANVFIYMLVGEEKLNESPKTNFKIVKNMGIPHKLISTEGDFNEELIMESDLIVDGIFGTGLSRDVEGRFKRAIELINRSGAFIVSVDIPSGVKADTGEVMGVAVEADLTPTFALAKPGHFLYPGRSYSGVVEVVSISTPIYLLDEFEPTFTAIDNSEVYLKEREETAHKGNFGHLAIVGGSLGKSGAVILASKAAIKSGVGLASAVIPDCINTAFESSIAEAMSLPLKSNSGTLSKDSIEDMLNFISDKSAVCFGMGLGVNDDTKKITREILKVEKPLVIDADGLNCLSEFTEELKNRKQPTILTPHPKEFSRLIKQPTSVVLSNRLSLAREFAEEFGVILVLKMADTLVVEPGGKIYINTTGNVGLATGGSGDVLSGIIGSFLSQGYDALKSAINGVYIHGLAADIATEANFTYESLTPTDVCEHINQAIKHIYELSAT